MSLTAESVLFYGFFLNDDEVPWVDVEGDDPAADWEDSQLADGWKLEAHGRLDKKRHYVQVIEHLGHLYYPKRITLQQLVVLPSYEASLRHFCEIAGLAYEKQEIGWWLVPNVDA